MQQFKEYMIALLGDDEYKRMEEALTEAPVSAFRPNTCKNFALNDSDVHKYGRVPWSSLGFLLKERPSFTFDPLFHAGAYYVQEPSSMFIEQALKTALSYLKTESPHHVLDLCAAPGGKSTLMRTILNDEDILVCNEPLMPRAQILLQNMLKWGHENVIVTSSYPAQFGRHKNLFDIIAVDAPCSGEGMFRKQSAAVTQWSPALTRQCAQLQRKIVSDAWNALRPGGFLIYSTCTYNTLEDEQNTEYFCNELGGETIPIPIQGNWGVTGNLLPGNKRHVYHFFPHKLRGEGFFLTLLQKKGEKAKMTFKSATKREKVPAKLDNLAEKWLKNNDARILLKDDTVYALPAPAFCMAQQLAKHCNILSAGTPFCEQKGHGFRPHHALALSRKLNKEAFAMVNLPYNDAIRYLHRESITLPQDACEGMVLAAYHDVPLGFANNLGARANNLYPSAWRILSSHAPESFAPLF